jgi:hypothetical protein
VFNIRSDKDWNRINAVFGKGTLAVDTNGNVFSFMKDNKDNFLGTLALSNTRFDLQGKITSSLRLAELKVGEND